jgi:hypothetical protein
LSFHFTFLSTFAIDERSCIYIFIALPWQIFSSAERWCRILIALSEGHSFLHYELSAPFNEIRYGTLYIDISRVFSSHSDE